MDPWTQPTGHGMGRLKAVGPRKGPKPRPDANRELVHLRVSPELYNELRAWAKEDDVSLSQEFRALALVGRLFFEQPAVIARLITDPKANRTRIIRDLERDARLLSDGTVGVQGA